MFITCGKKLRIPKTWEDELRFNAEQNGYTTSAIRSWEDYDDLLVKSLASDIRFVIVGTQSN